MIRPAGILRGMTTWGEFQADSPELAAFGAELLHRKPAYLATVRADGMPRVHPVTPILTDDALYLFMEPTSPKRNDLVERGGFALHNGVPDNYGSGGEFLLTGRAVLVDDPAVREVAVTASQYQPLDRYILFELHPAEARCHGYDDITLPTPKRWSAST